MKINGEFDLFGTVVFVIVVAIFCFVVYTFVDRNKTYYEADCPSGVYQIYENRNFYYLVETNESIKNVDNCLLIRK